MDTKRSSARFSAPFWLRWLVPVVLVLLILGLLSVVVLLFLP